MYELEQLEMEGVGETDGFDFEAVGELEDGEQEDQFLGDIIGGLFEEESLEAYEADPFLGDLLKKASSVASSALRGPAGGALKGLAKQAARVAGGAIAGPTGANIAGQIANQVFRESEYESEWESEYEDEAEGLDHEAFDEMNYYAAMAAEAETEEEADQFLGALLPVIGQVAAPLLGSLLGGDGEQEDQFLGDIIGGLFEEESGESWETEGDQFLPALLPLAMPLIKKGIGAAGKLLTKSKRTRPAVRALPKIAAKTIKSVASQARRGQRPTPKRVAATVARHTAKTLATRPQVAAAVRQNRAAASRAQARPRPTARPGARPGMRPTRAAGTNGARRAYPTATTGIPVTRSYTVTGGAPGGYGIRRHGPIIGYVRFPVYGTRRPH